MELVPNKTYRVVKKIKIHTKPLAEVVVPMTGIFVKQTAAHYIFAGFKVRKSNVISIQYVN